MNTLTRLAEIHFPACERFADLQGPHFEAMVRHVSGILGLVLARMHFTPALVQSLENFVRAVQTDEFKFQLSAPPCQINSLPISPRLQKRLRTALVLVAMNAKPLPQGFYLPGELQYAGTAADMVVILHRIAHERLYEYANTVKMHPATWDSVWRTFFQLNALKRIA